MASTTERQDKGPSLGCLQDGPESHSNRRTPLRRNLEAPLTSGGVTNASIRRALVDLLGKPTSDATALCIPTAQWGHPMCGPVSARGFVSGVPPWGGMTSFEWRSLGLLELATLPTVGRERWIPWVRDADVLLVDGGDATYLHYWMCE